MQVQIYGESTDAKELYNRTESVIKDLDLTNFIELTSTNDSTLATEIGISQDPALVIFEPEIDFKDMIFEGLLPAKDELSQMFVSIVGGGEMASGWGCSSGSCGTCSSEWSCGSSMA